MDKFPDSGEIGWKIKKLRQNTGLTQENLAEIIGVTFQQIQKYESGKTKLNTDKLQQVANALVVPVAAFFAEQADEASALSEQERKLIEGFCGIKSTPEFVTLSWLLSLKCLCLGVSGRSGHICEVHPAKLM